MPQLDFSTYISQVFWLLLAFGSIFLFASRFVIPRTYAIIKARFGLIEGNLMEAKRVTDLAMKLSNEQSKKLDGALIEAQEIIKSANYEAEVIKKNFYDKAKLESKAVLDLAKAKAKLAEEDIKSASDSDALYLISAALVSKVTNQNVSVTDLKNAVNSKYN